MDKIVDIKNENCNKHMCEDCSSFSLSNEENPCIDCSHGGKRYVIGAKCLHKKIHDNAQIERNRRIIRWRTIGEGVLNSI